MDNFNELTIEEMEFINGGNWWTDVKHFGEGVAQGIGVAAGSKIGQVIIDNLPDFLG